MIIDFLNFVDSETQYGKVSISGEKLFQMFVAHKNLSPNVAHGFRIRLQRVGVL